MSQAYQVQAGLAAVLLAGAWLLLRRQAKGGSSLTLLPLDVAPILLGGALLWSLTARPVMSASLILALAIALVIADAGKRDTLREPLVFADRAEAIEVVRHPQLYIPFAGPVRVAAAILGAIAATALLLWLEPSSWHPWPLWPALLIAAAVALPTRPAVLPRLARFYRRAGASGDPASDMRRFGFLASLVVQATLARDERSARQAAPPPLPPLPPGRLAGPVVLIQLESFFDARRLAPGPLRALLPGFERMRREAVQAGLLTVPCWGANTIRTEFEALTGIGQDTLGLDRFNPYERFAMRPTRSIAWQMKQAGYRTICLHPFDARFYGRDRVMPNLGFDEFRGIDVFRGAARHGLYVSDAALAEAVIRIIRAEGPRVFVFAISMGNHGPWNSPGVHPALDGLPDWPDLPDAASLKGFIAGLVAGDAMFAPLMDALPDGGTLAVYGDHQPALGPALDALHHDDRRTDYAVWQPGAKPGPSCDIRAADLPALLARLAYTAPQVDRVAPDLP